MICNEYYKIKIDSRNREKYKELGYQVNENDKELEVKVEHISIYSMIRIDVECDCCGERYTAKVDSIRTYRGKYGKDLCSKCKSNALNNDEYGKMPITLGDFFRSRMKRWYDESRNHCQRKCVITGEKTETVHHPYPFRKILFEAFREAQIDIRGRIDNYTEEEKDEVSEKCLELHYKYGLGVCMSHRTHQEYHSRYGRFNNTREQLEEFIEEKLKRA